MDEHITRPDTLASNLTVREYFAAMAMQGLLCLDPKHRPENAYAASAYAADELIDALNKKPRESVA